MVARAQVPMPLSGVGTIGTIPLPASGATGSPAVESAIGTNHASVASLSVAVTSTGANRLMVIDTGGYTASSSIWVTGVTVGGNAATLVPSSSVNFYDGTETNKLWYYVNPASGANTVTATWNGTANTASMCVLAITNANQSTPLGTASTVFQANASGAKLAITNTVTGATGDLFIDALGDNNNTGSINVGSGQTIEVIDNGGSVSVTKMSSKAGSASSAMIWTNTSAQVFSSIGVAVKSR